MLSQTSIHTCSLMFIVTETHSNSHIALCSLAHVCIHVHTINSQARWSRVTFISKGLGCKVRFLSQIHMHPRSGVPNRTEQLGGRSQLVAPPRQQSLSLIGDAMLPPDPALLKSAQPDQGTAWACSSDSGEPQGS